MRLSYLFAVLSAFLLAAGLSLVAARFAVSAVEDKTEIGVRRAFDNAGDGWAEVEANGLRVILTGTAPDEAARLHAVSVAGGVVDAARIINDMDVKPTADLRPPRFSVEILRNDAGISVIGLIPTRTDRKALIGNLQGIAGADNVVDLLETADYDPPGGWSDALAYAVIALSRLPRSKISVSAGAVSVTAIADSAAQRASLEKDLDHAAPPGLRLALDISAPRPVITPFALRYVLDEQGGRFDACSAENDLSRLRILAAARKAGLTGAGTCSVGMGVPSPNWARAVEQSLGALTDIGAGQLTFSDADITLVAAQGTDQERFDQTIGELEAALPKVFTLHAILPEPVGTSTAARPEFTATLSPEGLVDIHGRVNDDRLRQLVDSYAKARFGSDNVHMAARVAQGLPAAWPVRVLAGVEALSKLRNGLVTVLPDTVRLRGVSERETASDDISRLFADKLGDAATFDLDITYQPPPKPVDTRPDPETCERDLAKAQETQKITFEPGSATIAAASLDTMERIADILDKCGDIRLEIQGHTDSQGREEMNQNLSQARAQSVLNELRARRVLTSTYVAVGYGESRPIADNKTEAGREANRRIEFHLLRPEPALVPAASDARDAAEPPDLADAPDTPAPADPAGKDPDGMPVGGDTSKAGDSAKTQGANDTDGAAPAAAPAAAESSDAAQPPAPALPRVQPEPRPKNLAAKAATSETKAPAAAPETE